MARKKLVLITFEKDAKEHYCLDLYNFFEGYIDVEGYSLREGIPDQIEADLIVVTSLFATNYINSFRSPETEITYLYRTFMMDNVKKLFQLPPGTKVMLVDYSYESCIEIVSVLHQIGFKHIDLQPVYPSLEPQALPALDVAVTAGLAEYVPPQAKHIIDIGWTVPDVSTLMEVALKLDILDADLEERLLRYAAQITPIRSGLVFALKSSGTIKNQWDTVLDVIDDGIMVLDKKGDVIHWNRHIPRIFQLADRTLAGHESCLIIPYQGLNDILTKNDTLENTLVKIREINKSVLVSKRPLIVHGHRYGFIILVKEVAEIQNLESQLRQQLNSKGLVARYNFVDICGGSSQLADCIAKAKKIARIDATVLITGESGTGKELFAQSIHNASLRKNKPFVGINCAALPSSLLESELFGYEDGAFTNAKRGGKKGLFELAHTGTLFLDEIGDMPLSIQVKLLRVLQEREVMRIGGAAMIPVDVRVIAATNQDIRLLLDKGDFRRDLYYRLNVLTLHLPPLRDRRSDIVQLIDDIMAKIGARHKKLDDELLRTLTACAWEGNVRELKNCIEYMAHMGGDLLTPADLPPGFGGGAAADKPDNRLLTGFLPRERKVVQSIVNTLRVRNSGRRLLHSILQSQGIDTSEHEVRRLLDILCRGQYIEYDRGRGGARLTAKGEALSRQM